MKQLILVLEENLEIQKVIASSLKDSEISIIEESNPKLFQKQLNDSDPNLIFLSNTDSDNDYRICRRIRNDVSLEKIPIILLLNSKDNVEEAILSELRIDATLRKPFEASILKEHLSQFITLDERFGNGPDGDEKDFKIDMSDIGDQLKEIRHAKSNSNKRLDEVRISKGMEKNNLNQEISNLDAIEMDSMILENFSQLEDPKTRLSNEDKIDRRENIDNSKTIDGEMNAGSVEKNDDGIDLESGFEFDLELDEDEIEPKTAYTEKKSTSDGLEKLKNSGLENQLAESRLYDQQLEKREELEVELNDIDLDVNDFEEKNNIWERPDNLDLYHQTPREGLSDINLDESDFMPEFPKNLESFEEKNDKSLTKLDEISIDESEILDGMNNIEIDADLINNSEGPNRQDSILLIDSEKQDEQKIKELEEVAKLEEDINMGSGETSNSGGDTEIKSMVKDSFNVPEELDETGLDELEELSSQMSELESEEIELESEEIELESEEIELESEEIELESEEIELESEEIELESEEEKEIVKEVEKLDIEEDVFDTWEDAEEAFINFDRKYGIQESISEDFKEDQEKFEKAESYSFTEEELKEIVSNSVQKALEKSIATSLVELAVSELKTTVSEMDQDWA